MLCAFITWNSKQFVGLILPSKSRVCRLSIRNGAKSVCVCAFVCVWIIFKLLFAFRKIKEMRHLLDGSFIVICPRCLSSVRSSQPARVRLCHYDSFLAFQTIGYFILSRFRIHNTFRTHTSDYIISATTDPIKRLTHAARAGQWDLKKHRKLCRDGMMNMFPQRMTFNTFAEWLFAQHKFVNFFFHPVNVVRRRRCRRLTLGLLNKSTSNSLRTRHTVTRASEILTFRFPQYA